MVYGSSQDSFELITHFTPRGDQPQAIQQLVKNLAEGQKHSTLLGITGSGKTFTIANVICEMNRPSLIIAPNKTLAAQLYDDFKQLFPKNAVEYFVSYYDFYQPEAYIPSTDTFIEKDSSINDQIDQMRHRATHSLLSRRDVLIVSSVSCIYGLGSPQLYRKMLLSISKGEKIYRDELLLHLIGIQYTRNDYEFSRGNFRVIGDRVEIFPVTEEDKAFRITFFGDGIESLHEIDPITGKNIAELDKMNIYPGSHYVTPKENLQTAIKSIQLELEERVRELKKVQKNLEADRLISRTYYDIEMLEEVGYCHGIENYSRHLTQRKEGEPPPTLFEYFPPDFLLFIDESHITIPQIGGMSRGDRARKLTLVEHGFRLPSALDNRPLHFSEFESQSPQTIFVSATPGNYELEKSKKNIIELIIRPTGLIDPVIIIKPAKGSVDDLLLECKKRIEQKERILITALTKKMAEDLSEYYLNLGLKVTYLHSDIKTIERVEILRKLRQGVFDILIGINLLREGLDIPECSLVAILDADKEGFLRSERSLIQTIGRAARNKNGTVILYADTITRSIEAAIRETERRRNIQLAYNKTHGISPVTIKKDIQSPLMSQDSIKNSEDLDYSSSELKLFVSEADSKSWAMKEADIKKEISKKEKAMKKAAKNLDFEGAASLRDQIKKLKKSLLIHSLADD